MQGLVCPAALIIIVQYSDGCPHWKLAEQHLRHALADIGAQDAQILYQRIDSPADADRLGFHGSPTLLVNGRDPFPARDVPTGLGCRTYQTEEGARGAPSVAQLRHVLRLASH